MPAKRRAEGSSVGADPHDSEKNDGPARGRSREKGKGRNRDLPNALVKVGEVLGLEPEEGKEPRDVWKEFKKGMSLPSIDLVCPVPHCITAL